mmetsp:Transcript_19047/g.31021  ORF Transcript_19047/g.31021 Transcript_19047/m.31021 type:complete len:189 (-) Transcript_19047:367-933(-)|eukprot:jgi/Bigna1/52669/estExt_Genewise1Plus.C_100092
MELSHVGKHCSLKDCRQLDFLPFRCSHCKQSFCLGHRKPQDHQCKHYTPPRPPVKAICKDCNKSIQADGDKTIAQLLVDHYGRGECKKFTVTKPHRCNFCKPNGKKCKRREFDPIVCKRCNMNFCIKHRHAEDHNCKGLEMKKPQRPVPKSDSMKNPENCSKAARTRGSGTNLAHSRLVKQFQSVKVK